MTDLSTANLKRLLDEATPGPWDARRDYSETYHLFDAEDEYLGIMHDQDAHLTALAPELAQEVIRMREALRDLSVVWVGVSVDPDRLPAEQQLAATVVDHINQILGDHDDQL